MPRAATVKETAAGPAAEPEPAVDQPEPAPAAETAPAAEPAAAPPVDASLLAAITRVAEGRDLYFDSLLDVGSGSKPLANWFSKLGRAEAPRRYVCIEPHEATFAALSSAGHLALKGFSAPFDIRSDLVVASDVLEHVPPQRAARFLTSCAEAAGKLFALSTLNAGSWTRTGPKREFSHVRWVPTAALQCYRPEDDPSRILHVLDAQRVGELMADAFPANAWDVELIEAAPWSLRDLTSGAETTLSTKTFALATRKA